MERREVIASLSAGEKRSADDVAFDKEQDPSKRGNESKPDAERKRAKNPGGEAPKVKKKHMNPAVLEFRRLVQICCKTDDLPTAIEAYDKAVSAGIRVEAQSFYCLLNLCDGLGEKKIHVGTPKTSSLEKETDSSFNSQLTERKNGIDDKTRRDHAERIQKHMEELSLPLTENAYTALVRLYSRTNDVLYAEKLLDKAEDTQQCKPKLRLYTAILECHCRTGNIVKALQIWERLSRLGLTITEKEYAVLIECCVKTGDGVVVDRVLSDLAEDVLVPSQKTTRAISDWFASPHAISEASCITPCDARSKAIIHSLEKIKVPYAQETVSMGPVQCSPPGWVVTSSCRVDESNNGILQTGCLAGEHLEAITLSEKAWHEMKEMNETIARTGELNGRDTSEFQGGGKGKKRRVDRHSQEERQRHWTAFSDFLNERKQTRSVDLLIDGANVGFFAQNFAGAPKHVDYNQIDWIVEHFQKLGKSVLLVMHSRHFSPKLMPRKADAVVNKWLARGILYRTPPGMNDDWFWLHAALFFGPGTLVVTNDLMRDHFFQMIAPRSFLRWRDRHQIRFDFGGFQKDGIGQKVLLSYPDRYSRRMQKVKDGLVVPLPKYGDDNRFLDGSFLADKEEPRYETYLCIRPKGSVL